MVWAYKFIDHTADLAIDIEADSLNELFTASAFAWKEAISDENYNIGESERKIILEESSLEILIVSFLSELNFLFQNKKWMMTSVIKINVDRADDIWRLDAFISGFTIDPAKIKLKAEIKAVTYHQMEIKRADGKFLTRIVFDI